MTTRSDRRSARCTCGDCELVLTGPPIMTAACYCTSCRMAGERFEALPGGTRVLDADGSTAYVLQRKDRVTCAKGAEFLREHRLKHNSATRRVVATCCKAPMFIEFSGGHWLSVYRDRLDPQDRPAVEVRTMTIDRRPGIEFNDAIPSPRKHSLRFMWRLLAAWAAMGFRAPKIDYVEGSLNG